MTKICLLTVILIVQGLQASSGDSLGIRASKGTRDLIIGGTDADPKKFPFFSWLNFQGDTFSSISSCGGTLINPDVVMTAAQCIFGIKNIDVWVNSTSRKFSNYEYFRKSKQIVTHPKFSLSKNGNDIGLIFLDSPVKNVPVARLNRNVSVPGDVRSIVTAIGFGRTTQNSFGNYSTVIFDSCSTLFSHLLLFRIKVTISSQQMMIIRVKRIPRL
jgi:secreted trypsin-like serine protease